MVNQKKVVKTAKLKSKAAPEPIAIPKGILQKLQKNQEGFGQLQNQFQLLKKGDDDVRETILACHDIGDIPHQFDLQKGLITFVERNADDKDIPEE